MLGESPRVASQIDWAFAPEFLTIDQARFLTGHDLDYLAAVIEADGMDLDSAGQIEKRSLWEWQETVALLAHWDGGT
jgi:hypothetical protein